MKNGLFFCFLMFALYACKTPEAELVPWEGTWHLSESMSGWEGNQNYAQGAVTWTFHANQDVDVVLHASVNANLPIMQNGTYNCPVNNSKITINGRLYHFVLDDHGNLIVADYEVYDGDTYVFKRN